MDCGIQAELASSEYFAEFYRRATQNRVPVEGALDLTYRCNFRCSHCYVGHLLAQAPSTADEMDTAQVTSVLAAAAAEGCMFLLISGGEPLLRRDFLEIYVTARRLGMYVTVFTNASLMTPEHVEVLRHYPPRLVEVSVYGATAATYERVTGRRTAFKRAMSGIELLLEAGVRVGLKTMVLRDNVDEVVSMNALARILGVKFRLDPMLCPRLDGDPAPLAQRVDPLRAVETELQCTEYREDMTRYIQSQHFDQAERETYRRRLYLCGAGTAGFHVDPQGWLRPCLMSRDIRYSIGRLGFAEAWRAASAAVDEATYEGTGLCADCPNLFYCGYCPGNFLLENASPSHPPEYMCRLGEYRRRAIMESGPGAEHDGKK